MSDFRLRLRLLGRFAATIEGGGQVQALQISAPRHRVLLACLAMQPTGSETRERLATLLWSDRPDKQARQGLRQLLLTLRQELATAGIDPLRVERDRIGLDPAMIGVDARDLLALAESGADQDQALQCEYGVFLDGVTIDSESFDEWLRMQRSRVESAAAQLFLRCAEHQDAAGNGASAIRAAERLVALDPLHEESQRVLLRLLARYRGRDAALVHAARLAAMLREEMEGDPEPETASLIIEIERLEAHGARANADVPPAPAAEPGHTKHVDHQSTLPVAPMSHDAQHLARRFWRLWPRTALAAGAVVAITLIGTIALIGWPHYSATSDEAKTVADSWRAPVLPGVTADARAIAEQGAYPILVLPFTAAIDQGEEKILADRVSDDLTNELSRVHALRVIARATARVYAGRAIDVAAVGNELGVRYVVEGSVQLHEGRLRINAALIDVATRLQVWSQRFEVAGADRFAIQDEIARSIARHLNITVYANESQRRGPPRPGDTVVEELLAKGWNGIVRSFEFGATSGADSYFEEVLRRQPSNGSAMLGLAGYKVLVVAQFLVPEREPLLSEADALVAKVLTANPRSPLGNYYRGLLHKLRGEPKEALEYFTKVLELNPSFAPAYANVGHTMSRMGHLDDALEHIRYAIRLSPKDPNLGNWNLFAGQIELERGRDAAALEWIKRSVSLHPRSPFNHATLAAVLALGGDAQGAAKHAAILNEMAPWLTLDVMVERLTSTSEPDTAPHRLLEGLRMAFGGTTG